MGAVSLTVLVILIWNGYGVKNHPKAGAGFTTSDGVVMSYANQETGLYNDNLFGNSKPMISQELSLSGGDTRMQLSNAVGAIFGVTTPDPFDTREYLKTNYHATIKTRDITGLGERLKTIIRGHGGRIDYISLNEKTGSIGFIVPKKEYEQFKEELRGLTNKRFITERINENNLVEEKRMLENNAVNANNSIISLNQEKDVLIKNHQRTINSLNTQIVTVKKEIDSLQKQLTGPYFIENKEALELQLQQAQKKLQQLQNQLAYENKTYNQKLSPITASIKNSENQFRNLSDRNTALLTDVEMVNGSIILEWMSLPALFFLLKPFNWILVLLLGVGFVYRNYKKAQAELR